MKKIAFMLIGLVSLLFISAGTSLAQGQAAQGQDNSGAAVESDILWLWGEVSSLDTQNKSLTVKYFDYETDQEKEMIVATDSKTMYDNIKSFDEIKPQDTVSVDYTVNPEGKSVAKNISVEKPEGEGTLPQTVTPEVQPKPAAQDNHAAGQPEAAPTTTEKTASPH